MVNLHCCLHLMSAHGSATADASVMAPSPFAVKLSVGAVGAVGGGGALSQEVLSRRRSCLSPLVGGGAAACSPTVSQEEEEVVWAGRGACPHASHALARGAVPATASGPSAHLTRAQETLGSSRDNTLGWRCTSGTDSSAAGGASRQASGPHDLGCMRAWRFEPHVSSEAT